MAPQVRPTPRGPDREATSVMDHLSDPTPSPLGTPAWVMLGYFTEDGVAVLASGDLTGSELRARFPAPPPTDGVCDPVEVPNVAITLHVGISTYHIVYAPDYTQAVRAMLRTWVPELPTTMDEAVRQYQDFAERYRRLRAWAPEREVRRAYERWKTANTEGNKT